MLDVWGVWYYTSCVNKVNDRVDDCELCAGKTGSCLLDVVPEKYAIQLSHPAVTYRRNISPLCDKSCHERSFFMKRSKTQTLVLSALLMAMHIILSYFSLDLPLMKINLSPLPIILAGFLFGPAVGGTVGLIGSLLYQMLKFGIDPTTVLWIIPVGLRGFMLGGYAKIRKYKLKGFEMISMIILTSLIATILNTIGLYIAGYINMAEKSLWAVIGPRILNSVLVSIVCIVIVLPLIKPLRKFLHMAEK